MLLGTSADVERSAVAVGSDAMMPSTPLTLTCRRPDSWIMNNV